MNRTHPPAAPVRRATRTAAGHVCVAALVTVVAATTALSGCAPLVVGGAMVGGGLMAVDRRTPGTQVEDETIEIKVGARMRDLLGSRGNVNATSFNRTVLLTGEVPTEEDRAAVDKAVQGIENVRAVVNELAVQFSSSLASRSGDALTTAKVKATFVDAPDLMAHAVKVVTERGTVFLMGRVTEREAKRATELARSMGGVQRVVRIFDLVSEEELARIAPPKAAN